MDCKTNRGTDANNMQCGGKPADKMCSAYGNEYCCEGSETLPTMMSGTCSCSEGASQSGSDGATPTASDAASNDEWSNDAESSDAASNDWLASTVCLIILVQQFGV